MNRSLKKFYKKIKAKKVDTHTLPNDDKAQSREKDFETIDLNSIETEDVRELGSEWLCYQALEQLELRKFLEQQGWAKEWITTGNL